MTWTPQGGMPGAWPPIGPAGPVRPPGVIGPAVGMMVAGILNFLCGLVYLVAGLSNIGGADFRQSVDPGDTGGAIGYVVGSVFPILSVVAAPAIVSAGAQLLRGRTRGFVLIGAVAAVVPLTSCCFLAGIPMGIWTLVVLHRPRVRAWFGQPAPAGVAGPGYRYPPPPGW